MPLQPPPPPALSWAFVSALAFSQRLLKIDIDISVGKIILEKKYFTKRVIYQMFNCSKEELHFIPG